MQLGILEIPESFVSRVSYPFSSSPAALGFMEEELAIEGNVGGDLQLWRQGSIITVKGAVSAQVNVQCCRCLVDARVQLDPDITVRCIPGPLDDDSTLTETGEVGPDDDMYTYADSVLDLAPIIREQLVLAVPPYSYCRTDCQGLCAVCGHDLNHSQCHCERDNTDLPFSTLKDVKQNLG